MKKIVLTSILFASLIFTANAQVPDVKLGAKGGVNFSNITNSDMDSKTGFHIGVLAEVFFSEQFSLQPEILYSTQGAELKGDYSTAKYNLDYVSVPVMAKYYVVDGFNIQVGPQFSFLSKAEAKGEIDGIGSGTLDIKDNTESFDFGLNFGLGYQLPVGVFVDARYNLGLTKINKESISNMDDGKNSVFQISLGYKF
ncbi:MAG TPA: porin family protein [Flavobacteriaceae bacterium]|nr:porin family protein [Flavobacteriaceae bacterium]